VNLATLKTKIAAIKNGNCNGHEDVQKIHLSLSEWVALPQIEDEICRRLDQKPEWVSKCLHPLADVEDQSISVQEIFQ
jgi:hypothetical protein